MQVPVTYVDAALVCVGNDAHICITHMLWPVYRICTFSLTYDLISSNVKKGIITESTYSWCAGN